MSTAVHTYRMRSRGFPKQVRPSGRGRENRARPSTVLRVHVARLRPAALLEVRRQRRKRRVRFAAGRRRARGLSASVFQVTLVRRERVLGRRGRKPDADRPGR